MSKEKTSHAASWHRHHAAAHVAEFASVTWQAARLSIKARSDPAARLLYADLLACLAAALLPWSTTGFTILLWLWLAAVIFLFPKFGVPAFLDLLSRPICLLPIAIVVLAVVGTIWADVSWQERLHGIKPTLKLCAIPFLIYHFQYSRRSGWVFTSFLASSALLMGFSWVVLFAPELTLKATAVPGVPIRNYIDQTQEFALCAIAIAPCVVSLYKDQRYAAAIACVLLMLGFFLNMAFVAVARTALIYIPALLTVFALKYLDRRQSWLLFAIAMVTAVTVWSTSPYVRNRLTNIWAEYEYSRQNIPLSTGLRLEYWQKSLRFSVDAPFLGHGTGSIEKLFQREAVGKSGLAAEVTRNPHNQTLYVAIQWGMIGVIALYAMWLSHLFFFRGDGFASWVGSLVVVQNLFSSLLNSHLFDFLEGWIYVLGVGVAAGMCLRARRPNNLQFGG